MLYARVSGVVLHAIHTDENAGVCPTCNWQVRAKRGTVVGHHWAHAPGASCDPWKSAMSQWHVDWQGRFPEGSCEVVLDRHRADVLLRSEADPNDFQVIEFQNSPISEVDRANREEFWGDVVWVLNGPALSDGFKLTDDAMWFPRLKLAHTRARVFVDMCEGFVYERMERRGHGGPFRVKRRTYDQFVAVRICWERERAVLLAEARERARKAREDVREAELKATREAWWREEQRLQAEVERLEIRAQRAIASEEAAARFAAERAEMVERQNALKLERETREAEIEFDRQAQVEAEERATSKNLDARERRVRVERGMELAARTLAWDEANPDVAHKTNMALRELLLDRDPESPLLAEGGRCWVAEETLSATA